MSKYIAVIILPLFLFACNQQTNSTDDLGSTQNNDEPESTNQQPIENKTPQPGPNPEPSKSIYGNTDLKKIAERVTTATYLNQQTLPRIDELENLCTKDYYSLFGKGSFKMSHAEMFNTEIMKEEINRIVNDEAMTRELIKQINNIINSETLIKSSDAISGFSQICKNKNIYVIFSLKSPGLIAAIWKKYENLDFFMDGDRRSSFHDPFKFFPDFLNNKSVVEVFPKPESDLTHYWAFWLLDPITMQGKLVEKCNLSFEYTTDPFFANAEKSTLNCEKQYIPQ